MSDQRSIKNTESLLAVPIALITNPMRHPEVVHALNLIISGANINSQNDVGGTALMKACARNDIGAVKWLLENGADINLCTNFEISPLMMAICHRKTDIASMLIQSGANIDLQEIDGETALMVALRRNVQHVAKLLIEAGADLDLQDNEGVSARELLKIQNDVYLIGLCKALEEKELLAEILALNENDHPMGL